MPVNLAASGGLNLSGIFQDEDEEPKGGVIVDPEHQARKKSISAEDLQEVANLFEIRKKKKRQ